MNKKSTISFQDINYIYLGISSSANIYALSWEINASLKIQLKASPPVKIIEKSTNRTLFFKMFIFDDLEKETNFKLLANKIEDGYLVPQLKQFDYVLALSDNPINTQFIQNSIKFLRQASSITSVYPIPEQSFKKYQLKYFTTAF